MALMERKVGRGRFGESGLERDVWRMRVWKWKDGEGSTETELWRGRYREGGIEWKKW